MKVSFLGQGFEPESKNAVGNILQSLLADNRYNKFFCISAFASSFAADFLQEIIVQNRFRPKKNYTVIIGVDQEGTSKEALEGFNKLNINSYVFYQEESPIFHPKIYLCEGNDITTLIVGSSNLTGAGLFSNVESSLLIEFNPTEAEGANLLAELKDYYAPLFNLNDPNLFPLSSKLIKDLINKGIVPDSQKWTKRYSKYHPKSQATETKEIKDMFVIPPRKTARIPRAFKGRYKTNKVVSELITEVEYGQNIDLTIDSEYKVIWSCSGLTRRDLNIPTSGNTHPTGSMTLRKGNFLEIDQRHYFYENAFSSLQWERIGKSQHSYVADCNFRIIILGIDYGKYQLKITHNTDTESKTYKQNNSMSHLRWEEAKRLVAQEDLLQKSLYILKNINSNEYAIEIK